MKIIIVGKAASGKDFLKKRMIDRGFTPSMSYTTRPPRLNEINGVDYFFVTEEVFLNMVDRGVFKEWNVFGSHKWMYGTTIKNFDEANVFIMTPSGIKTLSPEERKKSFVIYLDVPADVRRERLLQRKDADDPIRRMKTDDEDFQGFSDYDMIINNHLF